MAAPVVGKPQVVEYIVENSETDVTAKQVKAVLEALTDAVYDFVSEGQRVRLPGLITFQYRVKKSKAIKKGTMVRNPSTGEEFPHAGRKASQSVVATAVVPKPLKDHVGDNLTVARATKLSAPAAKAPAKKKSGGRGKKKGRK